MTLKKKANDPEPKKDLQKTSPKSEADEAACSGADAPDVKRDRTEIETETLRREETRAESVVKRNLEGFGFVWTVFGTIYAIVSACYFVAGKWVYAPYSYILIGLIGIYIITFIVMICLYADDMGKGRKRIAGLKKAVRIFKSFANVMILIVAVVSMTGIVEKGMPPERWIVFAFTLVVALIQLISRIALWIFSLGARYIGRRYAVKVVTYVDGKAKTSRAVNALYSQIYKDDGKLSRKLEENSSAIKASDAKPTEQLQKPESGKSPDPPSEKTVPEKRALKNPKNKDRR